MYDLLFFIVIHQIGFTYIRLKPLNLRDQVQKNFSSKSCTMLDPIVAKNMTNKFFRLIDKNNNGELTKDELMRGIMRNKEVVLHLFIQI